MHDYAALAGHRSVNWEKESAVPLFLPTVLWRGERIRRDKRRKSDVPCSASERDSKKWRRAILVESEPLLQLT